MMASFRQHRGRLALCGAFAWIIYWFFFTRPSSLGPSSTRVSTAGVGVSVKEILEFRDSDSRLKTWREENERNLAILTRCLEKRGGKGCSERWDKVAVLGGYHFRIMLEGGAGGEQIWSRSIVSALKNLGYTILYTADLPQTFTVHKLFPSLIRTIILDPDQIETCVATPICIHSPSSNPEGIPIHKLFAFQFWRHASHPLGGAWTLNPEPYNLQSPGLTTNTYIGYSVEASCGLQPFVPFKERLEGDKRHPYAYIMGKLIRFFLPGAPANAWSSEIFDAAEKETGVKFMIGAVADPDRSHDSGTAEEMSKLLPGSLENVGFGEQSVFLERVAKSVALVGIGDPATSPTPYEALCLGVPFINPVHSWDESNPSDRTKWTSQHGLLQNLDPPYVYNVKRGDLNGFVKAMKGAMANPIERYVLPRMTMGAVEQRVLQWMEKDWMAEAARVMELPEYHGRLKL